MSAAINKGFVTLRLYGREECPRAVLVVGERVAARGPAAFDIYDVRTHGFVRRKVRNSFKFCRVTLASIGTPFPLLGRSSETGTD